VVREDDKGLGEERDDAGDEGVEREDVETEDRQEGVERNEGAYAPAPACR
jgi:hypothetical protein